MTTKTSCFEIASAIPNDKLTEIETFANNFKILSDPIRLKIIYLLRNGELCVCEIASSLNMSQPKISYHLKILTECNLISRRTDWVWAYYSLTDNIQNWLTNNSNLLKLLEEE